MRAYPGFGLPIQHTERELEQLVFRAMRVHMTPLLCKIVRTVFTA
jgi:hypothetical protein